MKLEADDTGYGTKDTKQKLSQERHPIHPSTSSFQIRAGPLLTPQAKPAVGMGWERDVGWSDSQALDQEWAVVNTGAEGPCLSLSYRVMALLVLCFKTVTMSFVGSGH